MKKRIWLVVAVLLIFLGVGAGLNGCRRVTLVGDSLFGCAKDTIINAINSNGGNSWVYKEHIWGGCTAYNNPVNHEIYSKGMEEAFSYADVVAFSLGSNDMLVVTMDKISMDSAIQAMQALMNQAVASGASCVVLFESSHRLRGDVPLGARFEMHMDEWFEHWHRNAGDNEYLGIPYKLLIADISEEIEANMDQYIVDYIHFNEAGAELAATAIVEQINMCPEGRWIFGTNVLKTDAAYAPNPHSEYKIPD